MIQLELPYKDPIALVGIELLLKVQDLDSGKFRYLRAGDIMDPHENEEDEEEYEEEYEEDEKLNQFLSLLKKHDIKYSIDNDSMDFQQALFFNAVILPTDVKEAIQVLKRASDMVVSKQDITFLHNERIFQFTPMGNTNQIHYLIDGTEQSFE